jgi:hypothetical protein
MDNFFEVLDVERITLNLDDSSLIFVDITIVRCAKYSYHARELLGLLPVVYFIALDLDLVGADHQG